MTEWLLAGIFVSSAAGLALAVSTFWPRRHVAQARVVLVYFRDPEADSIRGLLMRVTPDILVIARGELVRADGQVALDGDVVVDRLRVQFLQVLP